MRSSAASARRGAQRERRAARAARRADRRSRLFEEHVHILMDLIAVARVRLDPRLLVQAGATRRGVRIGERRHHRLPQRSHHGEREDRIMDFAKINRYHAACCLPAGQAEEHARRRQQPAREQRISSTDPDGRLEPPQPQTRAARRDGPRRRQVDRWRPSRLDGTPMANAMFSTLHALGRTDLQSFGDSSGFRSEYEPGGRHRRKG